MASLALFKHSYMFAYSVLDDFRIKKARAFEIIKEVVLAVNEWRSVSAKFGLNKKESDRMASAFEHEDLKKARGKSF